jgi:hypothetical protein
MPMSVFHGGDALCFVYWPPLASSFDPFHPEPIARHASRASFKMLCEEAVYETR